MGVAVALAESVEPFFFLVECGDRGKRGGGGRRGRRGGGRAVSRQLNDTGGHLWLPRSLTGKPLQALAGT